MEIKGENLDKILNTISIIYCHSTFCKDCNHEGDTIPGECTGKDCYERICEVLEGIK